jgi:hypothetical protein
VRSSRMLRILMLVCVALVAGLPALAQQHAHRVRKIVRMPNTPLASQLRSDDEIVEVNESMIPALTVMEPSTITPEEALEYATSSSDGIVVIDVESMEGRLVENDSWINTLTIGQVVDVIKPFSQMTVQAGQPLTVTQNGGVMKIQGKTVRTGDWGQVKDFVRGHRYLILLMFHPDGPTLYPIGYFDVQQDGRLEDTVIGKKGSNWRQALTGLTLDSVVTRMRSILH